MAEWKNYTLEEVCERIYSGGTPSTKHKEYWNGDIRWLSSGETSQRFVYDTERKITQKGVDNSSTKLATKGCTVIATAGQGYTRGQASFLMTDTYMNQSVIACKANEDIVLPLYLYYNLDSRYEEFRLLSDGTSTRGGLSGWIVKRMNIKLPPITAQKKIIGMLYAIDQKIEKNNAINKNLLQQLHVLYLRLFCNSAMDTPLGDVVATTSGGTPSRKHDEYYSDSSICWVKSKELLGNYIHETEEHINDLAIKKSSAKLLPEHSILIAMYGATVGAYGVISKPMTCNQAVCALLCNENYPYTYLFQIAYESQQKFINLAVGSAQQNISQVLIKQLNLHSDLNIIQRFHDLALPMHQEIEFLQAENIRLSDLRDNLLPKLMSGELDVSDVEI